MNTNQDHVDCTRLNDFLVEVGPIEAQYLHHKLDKIEAHDTQQLDLLLFCILESFDLFSHTHTHAHN